MRNKATNGRIAVLCSLKCTNVANGVGRSKGVCADCLTWMEKVYESRYCMKKTRLNLRGKKTREWERVRRQLKKRFMAAGITTCELKFPQCWCDNTLGFAHSRKRLDPLYDSREVVLACGSCHTAIEGFTHEGMLEEVKAIIANRERQP